ncbi:MAG: aldose 1-epimerase family protein [Actinomycetota bacterium]|nr:aldose 1-epimerase family protein [Actinomycetota bacterium]
MALPGAGVSSLPPLDSGSSDASAAPAPGGGSPGPPSGFPSGVQYRISHGEQAVMLTEVGAALRVYTVGGLPVLDGYQSGEVCTGARGQSLIPWPNRIRGGRYRWNGSDQQLDLSEPAKHGAIHGLTRWANWELVEQRAERISFRHILHACQGWSGVLDCRLDYELGDRGLTVRTSATNVGSSACPYGTGAHPYLSVGLPAIDPAIVTVPGASYLPVDDAGIPIGHRPVEGTPYDLRTAQPLGDRQIDVAYTELDRGADGLARVRLAAPDGGPAVELWVDRSYPYVEIFTGDALPDPGRRRTGLGVEPMTCAPDAFNSGEGLLVLEPGQSHSASWGIQPFAARG